MIAAALLAGLLATTASDPAPILVSPSPVSITGLRPGTTGAVDVTVTNISGRDAQVSVTGALTTPRPADEADLLQVDIAGCPEKWLGVPVEPTTDAASWSCSSGEIPASSGSLAAVPLEAGQSVHLLIAASLDAAAGNGANGQRWEARLDVQMVTNEPAVPVPTAPEIVLAITGGNPAATAAAAAAVLAAGAGAWHLSRRRTRARQQEAR